MTDHAVVIGSGFGGLACAIRLQAAGIATTLVERRDQPGGRAYVYRDAGFTFDAGPTVITAPECIDELFSLAGRARQDAIELLPVDPFYRLLWDDGFRFDYGGNPEVTREQIRAIAPDDVAGYDRFLRYTDRVFEAGYARLAHVPFLHFTDMIRVAPELVRLEAYRTVYGVVRKHFREPHLRQAFSFHSLLVGGNPFAASSIYTLIHCLERRFGVFYPRGGTGALVTALVDLFRTLGGTVRLGFEVARIEVDGGRVHGVISATGERVAGSIVVSNADVVHSYGQLLGHHPHGRNQAGRLGRRRHSMSLFVAYFGLGRKYPGVAHHTVLFGPRYRELLGDIFDRGVLADDFSLYLHAPTVTDPSLAPSGCDAFYVLSPVPHLGRAPLDWTAIGPRYADRILDYLERKLLPGLRHHLVTLRTFTPRDFATELNAHWGSAFSLEPILTQSAYFRVHNRDPQIGGLYFVGAGTHPGAGLPGVINSAKATASVILAARAR
ncbi:MAG: phytoene desaturase [Gemmatimonadetes bacterium]|nr:phytoene desaturase [Gemmatimonadota bacterium]